MECPACGHELSMFTAPEPERGERMAVAIADRVATWWFPTGILVAVSAWLLINAVARPFEPYPVIALAWISAVLATVAACQGPLILLAQRRAAMHDRQRDDETLRVASHNEADLHTLSQQVESLDAKLTMLLENQGAT